MQSTAILLFVSFLLSLSTVLSAFSFNNELKKHYRRDANKSNSSSFHDTGVLYKQSVLSKQEYDEVQEDLANLSLVEEQASIAHHRIGAVVRKRTSEIFRVGSVKQLLRSTQQNRRRLCTF